MNKLFFLIFFLIPSICFGSWTGWEFDWDTQVDGDGNAAGSYATTPFPLTESSIGGSYTIYNDENLGSGTTFALPAAASVRFVDASPGGDCSGNYNPTTRACDGSGSYDSFNTINEAIADLTAGNRLILIRAGTYSDALNLDHANAAGTSTTQRYIVSGYGQERPILTSSADLKSNSIPSYFYLTLQRLEWANTSGRALYAAPDTLDGVCSHGQDLMLVDLLATNAVTGNAVDAAFHLMEICDAWLYHVEVDRSQMKGIKVAEGSDDMIVEWSKTNETGYWSTISTTPYAHAYALDIANDGTGDDADNPIVRYNSFGSALFGSECRYCPNYDIHHNLFYDSMNADAYTNEDSLWASAAPMNLRNSNSYGSFHDNVIRDQLDTQFTHSLSVASVNNVNPHYVYNNVIYNSATADGFFVSTLSGTDDLTVYFYNNTVYVDNSTEAVNVTDSDFSATHTLKIFNNVIHQAGSGKAIDADVALSADTNWDYNLYFYPSGTLGETAGSNDVNSGASTDPDWVAEPPWGTWSSWEGSVNSGSAAVGAGSDFSAIFTDDLQGTTRSAWDIGAYEYTDGAAVYHNTFKGGSFKGGSMK